MNVQLPFDPATLVLSGLWHGIGLAVSMLAAAPIWVQALLVAALTIRFFRQDFPLGESPRRRSRRRRWRRNSWG
jgi:hypothetical protein